MNIETNDPTNSNLFFIRMKQVSEKYGNAGEKLRAIESEILSLMLAGAIVIHDPVKAVAQGVLDTLEGRVRTQ